MKHSFNRTPTNKQGENTTANTGGGVGGVSAPAVPVLQKAAINNNEQPTQAKVAQLTGDGVVQMIKVGDEGAGSGALAVHKFKPGVFLVAKKILNQMEAAKTEYTNVEAIIAAVNAHPDMIAALATPPAAAAMGGGAGATASASSTPAAATGGAPMSLAERLAAQEAAEAAAKARDGARYEVDPDVALTQGAIDVGSFALIPPDGVRERDGDYELTTKAGSAWYKFHIHPPKNSDNEPAGGQIMVWDPLKKKYVMTGKTTSAATIKAITDKHGWPAGWPKKGGGGGGAAGGGAGSPATPSA